jgi:N-acetylneuraminic acid mutarotase
MSVVSIIVIIGILFSSAVFCSHLLTFPLTPTPVLSSMSPLSSQQQPSQLTQELRSLLSWTNGVSMPTPRSELAGAVLDGKIYIVGGLISESVPTNVVEVYDPKIEKWVTVAPLPEPLDHTAASSYNGKLYVVGGYNENELPSNKLFIFDPSANKWQEGKPMPTPRAALTANFIDGILYAVGGKNKQLMGYFNETLSTNEAYNPQTNTWTHKTSMPTPRHHLTSAVVDGKLYVIGGRQTNQIPHVNVNANEMYNPKYDNWSILKPMPTKRSAMAAVSVHNDIYVFGGSIEECPPSKDAEPNRVFGNNEKYDTKYDIWTSQPPVPTARHGPTVAFVSDKIYVIGGGPKPCFSKSNINEIFRPVDISENQLVKS